MVKVRTIKRGKLWSYAFEVGRIDGKRKTVQKSGFTSGKLAYNAGVIAYDKYLHGGLAVNDGKVIFSDFLDEWYNQDCKLRLRQGTLKNYEIYIRCHIKPYIGQYSLNELTPAIIDSWLRRLIAKKYAVNIDRIIFALVKKSLDYAVYPVQALTTNPAQYVKFPKLKEKKKVKRVIINDLNPILDNLPRNSTARIPIIIGYYTGMRVGEITGLTWNDVDFDNKTININKQVTYMKYNGKSGSFVCPTKTDNSVRTILVGDTLLRILRKWKATQAENRLKAGQHYLINYGTPTDMEDTFRVNFSVPAKNIKRIYDFICTDQCGMILNKSTLQYLPRKLLKDKGITFNFHSLRHTQATLAIEGGAPSRDVAARLGDTVTTINKVYSHDTVKMQEQTVAIIESIGLKAINI